MSRQVPPPFTVAAPHAGDAPKAPPVAAPPSVAAPKKRTVRAYLSLFALVAFVMMLMAVFIYTSLILFGGLLGLLLAIGLVALAIYAFIDWIRQGAPV